MIISASRRTDIPAFYATWFLNRIRAGYCAVPNPVNPNQVSRVSLSPSDVDVIVFWTRHPRPLIRHLIELDEAGFHYYFLYTILGYPSELDPRSPSLDTSIQTFRELSEHIGPDRVVWRYDPIVFTARTSIDYHRSRYDRIASLLQGATRRCIVSVVDVYRKTKRHMDPLKGTPFELADCEPESLRCLMQHFGTTARSHGIEVFSCAEETDFSACGVCQGKCIDDELITRAFHGQVSIFPKKDAAQREACGCITSREIGMYDSCAFGCRYCYATRDFQRARENHRQHRPESPSLLGWYEPTTRPSGQLPLFE